MALSKEEYLEMAALARELGDTGAELEALEGIELTATQDPPQQSVDNSFSPMNMVGNIPESAGNMLSNTWEAVKHPVDTAKGLGRLGMGALYNANEAIADVMPESLGFMSQPMTGSDNAFGYQDEATADAAGGALMNRYGGVDEALNTLESDPVGVLGDVAGLVSGIGAAGRIPSLNTAGAALNPVNAAINAGQFGVSRLTNPFPSLPASMYESAAKFPTTMPSKDRAALIETAMDNKLMPTSAGMESLTSKISSVGARIDGLIEESVNSGQSLPVGTVFNHLGELWGNKGGALMEAGKDKSSISRIARELRANIENSGKTTLNADDLQKIKRDLYEKINFNSKNQTGTKIKEDIYKSVAKSAKEGVETLAPDVKSLNKEMGGLLELEPHLQRAAGRVENRDFVPLKATTGSGFAAIDPNAAAASAAVGILELPRVKARAALILNELKNTGNIEIFLKNNQNISRAELTALMAGQSKGALDQEESYGVLAN